MAATRVGRFEVLWNRPLGEGGFAKVYLARDTGEVPPLECAAKVVRAYSAEVAKEVEMLRAVEGHESVIRLLDVITPDSQDGAGLGGGRSCIFLEYATGGDLFDRLTEAGRLTEGTTLPYAANVMAALAHCHRRGIVHRDIKLENLMLLAEDPDAIKLVDFGLAVQVELAPGGQQLLPQVFYDRVGSAAYKAPELFTSTGGYLSPPLDAWSTGVMLFSLLAGFFPWELARPTNARFSRYLTAAEQGVGACDHLMGMYRRQWRHSSASKDFIDRLLVVDPARRMSVFEACEHEWLVNFTSGASAEPMEDEAVYRSMGGGGKEEEDGALPESALRPQRQHAMVEAEEAP